MRLFSQEVSALSGAGCRCGRQEGALIDTIRGPVTDAALDRDLRAFKAEQTDLRPGTPAYHYFGDRLVNDEPLAEIIWQTRAIKSRVQCLSEQQIVQSVAAASEENRPHYGDGAYCTLHAAFEDACPEVVVAHGIKPAEVPLRVVIRLEQPDRFRRFPGTGGVTRSIPLPQAVLIRDDMVGVGETSGEIRLLRIEAFRNGRWVRLSGYARR